MFGRSAWWLALGVLTLAAAACTASDGSERSGSVALSEASASGATTTSVAVLPGTSPGRGAFSPEWQPHWLDPAGTTLSVMVVIPCGSRWENIEATTSETADVVAVTVAAVEVRQGHCEAAGTPHSMELHLEAPLEGRTLIDSSAPVRELVWRIPPGWVLVRPRMVADDGAIGTEVPDDTILVVGKDQPQMPLSMDQVRAGVDGFTTILVPAEAGFVGVYGFIDSLPLQPDAPMQGTIDVAAPPTQAPRQELWIHLLPGAISMSPTGPIVDPSRFEFRWRPLD